MGAVIPLLMGRIRRVSHWNSALRAKLTALVDKAKARSYEDSTRYSELYAAIEEAEQERAKRDAARAAAPKKPAKAAAAAAAKKKKPATKAAAAKKKKPAAVKPAARAARK